MDLILAIALMVVFALVGAGGGYFYRKNMAEKRIGRTEEYAKKLLDDATRKAAETKKATQKQLMQKQLTHRMETTHPTTLPLTFWRHLMRTTIPRMAPTNPRATEEASRTSASSILRIS